jgi:hypothetical protein
MQIGTSGTATDNFTIRQPATPDGTVRIANGNSGTTTDLVTLTSAGNMTVVGTTSVAALTVNGNNISAVNSMGFRNRIINGNMVIDQRNAGASFTSSGNQYCLDRWLLQAVGATNTAQQVTGSTGNNKAVRITGNTANTLTGFSQRIESWNIFDVAGQSVTVSFTLSGSTSGSVSIRRLYPTVTDNYTATTEPASGVVVNFTTTPTRYTVTFTADTNANKGLWFYFDFGAVGSGVTRTLEEVQLEAGTVATPFERRDIGRELLMCQRYFQRFSGLAGGDILVASGIQKTTSAANFYFKYSQTMRSSPTVTFSSVFVSDQAQWTVAGTLTGANTGLDSASLIASYATNGATYRPVFLTLDGTSSFLTMSSEL